MSEDTDLIHSEMWGETPATDNPFVADQCVCAGFDVYGDLLGKVSFIDYLYLLFKREQPSEAQSQLLNGIAVAIGNPGPRDYSVQAAMSGGAPGAPVASCLMAALAVGAGNFGGAREIWRVMMNFGDFGCDLAEWTRHLAAERERIAQIEGNEIPLPNNEVIDVWLPMEHPAGFDPRSSYGAKPVRQTLDHLASISPGSTLPWLAEHRVTLEQHTGMGLGMTAVAAAAFTDLELDAEAGEMLYLLLRLPGAAAHSLEQRVRGWRDFPFYGDKIVVTDNPLAKSEEQE